MNKATLPRVSGPYSFENLSLFLLHGEDRVPSGSYRALQQAMESKSTAVYETGTVGELLIENLGDLDVFIQAGDILKGGRQDRVIGVDFRSASSRDAGTVAEANQTRYSPPRLLTFLQSRSS